MGKVIEAREVPGGEKVYLRKDKLGYHVVHPVKNKDGSMNWFNFLTGGSWWNLVIIIFIVATILGMLYEYSTMVNMFLNCFSGPIQLEICKQSFGVPGLNIYP